MNNDSNSNAIPDVDGSEPKVKLPEPDLDNITVLTENLPNKPILPWNRYDSDWDENTTHEHQDNSQIDRTTEE